MTDDNDKKLFMKAENESLKNYFKRRLFCTYLNSTNPSPFAYFLCTCKLHNFFYGFIIK